MASKMMFGNQGVDPCMECPEKETYTGLKCRQIIGDRCPKYTIGESYHVEDLGLAIVVRDDYIEPEDLGAQSDQERGISPSVKIPLNAVIVTSKYL